MNKMLIAGMLSALTLPAFAPAKSLSDARSIVRRSDGNYDIICRSGARGMAAPAQVNAGAICLAPVPTPMVPPITDPFHASFCDEPSITNAQAVAKLRLLWPVSCGNHSFLRLRTW